LNPHPVLHSCGATAHEAESGFAPAVSRAAELGQVTILFGLEGDQFPV